MAAEVLVFRTTFASSEANFDWNPTEETPPMVDLIHALTDLVIAVLDHLVPYIGPRG